MEESSYEWNPESNYFKALQILNLHHDQKHGKEGRIGTCKDGANITTASISSVPVYSIKEIEHAYRRLARKHHPDRGGEEQEFIALNAAKDFLVNGGASKTGIGASGDFDFSSNSGARNNGRNRDNNSGGLPSRILLHGRSCIRDLASTYDKSRCFSTIIAATDEGLKLVLEQRGESNLPPGSRFASEDVRVQQKSLTSEAISCCDLSPDGNFAFVGNRKGQVHRFYLPGGDSNQQWRASSDPEFKDHDEALDHLIGYPFNRQKGGYDLLLNANVVNSGNIVSVVARNYDGYDDDSTSSGSSVRSSSRSRRSKSKGKKNHNHLIFTALESPPIVAVLQFQSASVETVWRTSCSHLDGCIGTIDVLHVTSCPASATSDNHTDDSSLFRIWCGGSNNRNEAILMGWDVDHNSLGASLIESQEEDDDGWGSDDSFDSDCSHFCENESNIVDINSNLGFGSVYSIDDSPILGLQAAAVGTDVIILNSVTNEDTGEISLQTKNILATSHTLYAVRILTNYLQVAACGGGECIMIWSLVTGTASQSIHLNVPTHCNLCTNCIMALDLLELGNRFRSSIISGGYDGNVTQWYIDTTAIEGRGYPTIDV